MLLCSKGKMVSPDINKERDRIILWTSKSEQFHHRLKCKYSQTQENFLRYPQEYLQLQDPTSPMDLPANKA